MATPLAPTERLAYHIAVDELLHNRYRLVADLGHGGMARVHRAVDVTTGAECVVKMLSVAQAKDLKSIELFEREVEVLKALDHPSIPAHIDAFVDEGDNDVRLYLVQEWIEGETLLEAIQHERRFSERELVDIAQKVITTLRFLHGLRPPVIHRDIKPSNVVLGADDEVYLIDFGAVGKVAEDAGASGSTVVGTFGYMAPEQFQGKAFPETDYYGLGASLLHAYAHREPSEFPSREMAINFRGSLHCSKGFGDLLQGLLLPYHERRADWLKNLDQHLRRALFVPKGPPAKKAEPVDESFDHPVQDKGLRKRIKRVGFSLSAAFLAFSVWIGFEGYPWNGSIPRPGEIRMLIVMATISLFFGMALGAEGRPKKRYLWAWFTSIHVIWLSVLAVLFAGFPSGPGLAPADVLGALGLTLAGAAPALVAASREARGVGVIAQEGAASAEDDELDLDLDSLETDESVWKELEEEVQEADNKVEVEEA